MVTLAYFMTGTLLLILIISFDLILFRYSLTEALNHVVVTDVATGKYIVLMAAVIGLVWAIVTDYRLYKNKPPKKQ